MLDDPTTERPRPSSVGVRESDDGDHDVDERDRHPGGWGAGDGDPGHDGPADHGTQPVGVRQAAPAAGVVAPAPGGDRTWVDDLHGDDEGDDLAYPAEGGHWDDDWSASSSVPDDDLDWNREAARGNRYVMATDDAPPPPGSELRRSPRRTEGVRRGRRVKRVLRRIELWSVLKLALILFTCLYLVVLVSLALIWGLLYSTGQVDNVQKFLGQVGLDNFRFYGDQMFRACAAIGAVLVLAGSVLAVLTTALINLISELTGGIRFVVIEEDLPVDRRR